MNHEQEIRCLIIEDEPIASQRIARMLQEYPSIRLLGICEDGLEARERLSKGDVDVIFLDIHMPNMDGLSMIRSIKAEERPYIIFATAYDEFAVQAFDLFAIDYLLKPYSKERFRMSMAKMLGQIRTQPFSQQQQLQGLFEAHAEKQPTLDFHTKRLSIKLGRRTYFLLIDQIEYINSAGNYLEIFADEKTHVLRDSLIHVQKNLPPNFIRIHKSSIINTEFIEELIALGSGDFSLKMKNGKVLRISDSYKKSVLALLKV